MARFVQSDQPQRYLLPRDLRDWLPHDDLAHFVVEAVERVPMLACEVNERGTGSARVQSDSSINAPMGDHGMQIMRAPQRLRRRRQFHQGERVAVPPMRVRGPLSGVRTQMSVHHRIRVLALRSGLRLSRWCARIVRANPAATTESRRTSAPRHSRPDTETRTPWPI